MITPFGTVSALYFDYILVQYRVDAPPETSDPIVVQHYVDAAAVLFGRPVASVYLSSQDDDGVFVSEVWGVNFSERRGDWQ